MAKRSLPSTRSFHDAGMALPRAATLRVGDLAAAAIDRAAIIRQRPSSPPPVRRQPSYVTGPVAFARSSVICMRAAATSSSLVLA